MDKWRPVRSSEVGQTAWRSRPDGTWQETALSVDCLRLPEPVVRCEYHDQGCKTRKAAKAVDRAGCRTWRQFPRRFASNHSADDSASSLRQLLTVSWTRVRHVERRFGDVSICWQGRPFGSTATTQHDSPSVQCHAECVCLCWCDGVCLSPTARPPCSGSRRSVCLSARPPARPSAPLPPLLFPLGRSARSAFPCGRLNPVSRICPDSGFGLLHVSRLASALANSTGCIRVWWWTGCDCGCACVHLQASVELIKFGMQHRFRLVDLGLVSTWPQ